MKTVKFTSKYFIAYVMLIFSIGCGGGAGGGGSEDSDNALSIEAGDPVIGVNLAGAEFSDKLPGNYGVSYIYPNKIELAYYKDKCMLLIRLPFSWENLQTQTYADLDDQELERIKNFVAEAKKKGMKVILDIHNYGRYYGAVIGSNAVPISAFADVWQQIANEFKDESAIYAYGLMNEPHDMNNKWPQAAQAAVDAIRKVDDSHIILVGGDGWSSAEKWPVYNASLDINDPASKIIYEAHIYFDDDGSGSYDESYQAEGAYPEIGFDRLMPFLNWLDANKNRGFIGEFGVPANDSRWLVVLENFLTVLEANEIGGTCWAGGPWWGDYILSVEPDNGEDKPQISLLKKYSGVDDCR
jgi:endoglucanase